nr:hypothetical protein [Tanacetum cinerariifolium]
MFILMFCNIKKKIDPNTSIGRLCLGDSNQGLVAEGIENKKQWEGPKFQDTASSGQKREAKIFTFYRIEEEGERYFTPCYMGRLHAYDGEINLKSFMRLAKGIADFGTRIITIHPELDPFLDNSEETEKFEDNWDHLLDIDSGDIPEINKTGLPPFVKGEALKEKEDPGAFIIPIRLEAKIGLNALADTNSDINVMPYQIYAKLGREEVKKVNREITMLNHSMAEPMRVLKDVVGFLYTFGSILNTRDRITSTFDVVCHQTFREAKTSPNTEESDNDDEEDYGIQRYRFGAPMYGPKPAK